MGPGVGPWVSVAGQTERTVGITSHFYHRLCLCNRVELVTLTPQYEHRPPAPSNSSFSKAEQVKEAFVTVVVELVSRRTRVRIQVWARLGESSRDKQGDCICYMHCVCVCHLSLSPVPSCCGGGSSSFPACRGVRGGGRRAGGGGAGPAGRACGKSAAPEWPGETLEQQHGLF